MMKILILSLIPFLLQAQSLNLLLMDDISYEAETLTYQARVEADGGEVISLGDVNDFYIDAKANDYLDTLKCAYLITGGFKLSGTDVLTWYDLSTNDLDIIPNVGGQEATYTVDGVHSGLQKTDAALVVNQPYTFYSILTRTGAVSGFPYIWGSGSDAILYATNATNNISMTAGVDLELTNGLALNTPRLYTFIHNGASSSAQYNDVAATTGNAGATNINKVYIFNNNEVTIFPMKALIITPMLSTAKNTALKAILNTLYSVY